MMTRRTALSLLSAMPLTARRLAQTRAPNGRRVFCTGNRHFLLEADGTAMGWTLGPIPGTGAVLGLGRNDRPEPHSANAVAGLKNAVSIAVGSNASYALLADGRVVAWGANTRGNLGNTPLAELERTAGPRALANAPTLVLGLTDAVAVAARHDHALAVTRAGHVYAWGWGQDGQLGIGAMPVVNFTNHSPAAMTFVPYPIRIPELTDVVAVACGVQHSLALLKDGTMRAWGNNRRGQLGDGTTTTRRTPVAVPGIRSAVAIAAHSDNSAAVLADGTLMTWGYGGALGRRPPDPEVVSLTPGPVVGVTGVRDLAFADVHALALTTSGTVVSWGFQMGGEVGHRSIVPTPIPGLANVQSIAATTGRSFAVLADGTIMTWGAVPLWARVFGDPGVSPFPIPLTLKGLRNPP